MNDSDFFYGIRRGRDQLDLLSPATKDSRIMSVRRAPDGIVVRTFVDGSLTLNLAQSGALEAFLSAGPR